MFAVIRLRGSSGVRGDIRDTLEMLRLKFVNNCVILPERDDYKGMVDKVKDYVTYGEIDKKTLVKMLEKRIRLWGNKRVDEKVLKEVTKFESFEKLADGLMSGKTELKNFKEVSPVFRLSPPSKGLKSIKEHYPKGDLGYRGEKINELIERMI